MFNTFLIHTFIVRLHDGELQSYDFMGRAAAASGCRRSDFHGGRIIGSRIGDGNHRCLFREGRHWGMYSPRIRWTSIVVAKACLSRPQANNLAIRRGQTCDIRCSFAVGQRRHRQRGLQHNVRDCGVRPVHDHRLEAQLVAALSGLLLLLHIDPRHAIHHLRRQHFLVR